MSLLPFSGSAQVTMNAVFTRLTGIDNSQKGLYTYIVIMSKVCSVTKPGRYAGKNRFPQALPA